MKQSFLFTFSIIAFILISLSSCDKTNCFEGQGSVETRVFITPEFQGVRSMGSWNVFIEDGDVQEVRAVGHPNIIDRLQIDVNGGVLDIDLQSDCYENFELAIYITTPSIESAILKGSGDLSISDMDNESDLFLEIDGSGDIDIREFTGVGNLEMKIDGSGEITAHEDFPDLLNMSIEIQGSGDYKGFQLISDNAEVLIDGSGDVRLHVLENLNISIDGSGDVFYKGNPVVTTDISGSGDVVNSN